MKRPARPKPRVLLLWPGTEGAAAGNFGVPQLVLLATYLRKHTGVDIEIRDLVGEAVLSKSGRPNLAQILDHEDGRGYDIIAFSVYSSFDLLKCEAIASIARERWPEAVIVAGGYHASARPTEIVYEGSAFDVCVVGEGEKPLVEIVESVLGGEPMRQRILGPDAIDDLDVLPATDWSFLNRYRGVARKMASQTQLYLSRGCPFDCAFCMERAKREVSWRSLSVERAVEEMVLLHRFLDLRTWTLYIADALFGMKKRWRRAFLTELAKLNLPVEKIWLLIRVDLVTDEDLELFDDANCGLGFGLESGDPTLLAAIRKAGKLDDYLERMMEVAAWARERDVPWGANIITGHPGETPATLERSAKYMENLFLDKRGTTGFLSVDAFRLYPGSPIDTERAHYERTYGTRFHRPSWWQDGDQAFLAEWIDPSSELTYLEREEMQHRLLGPVLDRIEDNFVYQGKARDYFVRAIRGQAKQSDPAQRLYFMDRYYAWMKYLGFGSRAVEQRRDHQALHDVAKARRALSIPSVLKKADAGEDDFARVMTDALSEVPRENFVPLDLTRESVKDRALALDPSGASTISAMHAYALSFSLLEIEEGDVVLDAGGGTGYGAALLSELVGETGRVVSIEIDPDHSEDASRNLASRENARAVCGDVLDLSGVTAEELLAINKVTVGFALEEIPRAFIEKLAPGCVIVAPLIDGDAQTLTRATLTSARALQTTEHARVVYVPTRRGSLPSRRKKQKPARGRRLPLAD